MAPITRLTSHLQDAERVRALQAIEGGLVEHALPPQLVVENTSYCNLKCIHCSHREMLREQRHMARDLWDKIVEEVGREAPGCELWPTFYGEALVLGDELWDRLDHAAERGCRNLVLNSNGTLLGRKGDIGKVLGSSLRRFILSLDGLTPETFERVRAKARWDVVYPAVEELCRRRAESGQRYPVIIAQFSVMKENVHEIEAFRRYWKARGAEVKVRPMLEWTATGTVRTETINHDGALSDCLPVGKQHDGHSPGRHRCHVRRRLRGTLFCGQHPRSHHPGGVAAPRRGGAAAAPRTRLVGLAGCVPRMRRLAGGGSRIRGREGRGHEAVLYQRAGGRGPRVRAAVTLGTPRWIEEETP